MKLTTETRDRTTVFECDEDKAKEVVQAMIEAAIESTNSELPKNREVSLVITKLQEALLWLTKVEKH